MRTVSSAQNMVAYACYVLVIEIGFFTILANLRFCSTDIKVIIVVFVKAVFLFMIQDSQFIVSD